MVWRWTRKGTVREERNNVGRANRRVYRCVGHRTRTGALGVRHRAPQSRLRSSNRSQYSLRQIHPSSDEPGIGLRSCLGLGFLRNGWLYGTRSVFLFFFIICPFDLKRIEARVNIYTGVDSIGGGPTLDEGFLDPAREPALPALDAGLLEALDAGFTAEGGLGDDLDYQNDCQQQRSHG